MATKPKTTGTQTVFWWIIWITLTIASFFIGAAFWTPIIADHFGSIRGSKAAFAWVAAVFGTWLIVLVPLIIVMYQKVDKAYEDVRIRRENAALVFRSISIDKAKRLLPAQLRDKIRGVPPSIERGHLVNVVLKDGRQIPNVFIADCKEILGIYDYTEYPFSGDEIHDIEVVDLAHPPQFRQSQWLRLDGVSLGSS
ncbi:MAG: hypothetical protein Q8R76_04195 [Candidatus Omnitrophota bacterium]|nr:hypothetical protein [Candidatus Omnitrophota bacterium]